MLGKTGLVSVVVLLLGVSAASGQTDPKRTAGAQDLLTSCAGVAVFSAGSGPDVHVIRHGTLDQTSPLTPLTKVPPAVVLEVNIRGKPAAAYGPSFQEMRRAGPAHELEREVGNPIEWAPNLASLPAEIRLLGEDNEVLASLRYSKCVSRKKVAPPRAERAAPQERPTGKAKAPALPMPRGALE
jgi:hypothetical protein